MTTHETSADSYVMIDNYQFLRKYIFTKSKISVNLIVGIIEFLALYVFMNMQTAIHIFVFHLSKLAEVHQDYIYTRSEGHQEYHLRIRYVEVRNKLDQNLGYIYLISPIDDDSKHHCVYGRITTSVLMWLNCKISF